MYYSLVKVNRHVSVVLELRWLVMANVETAFPSSENIAWEEYRNIQPEGPDIVRVETTHITSYELSLPYMQTTIFELLSDDILNGIRFGAH
jgi:hypothetical protein